jgi:uracil-DNA glycosylase
MHAYSPLFYDQVQAPDESKKKDWGTFHFKSQLLHCHACDMNEYHKWIPEFHPKQSFMVIGETPQDIDPKTEQGKKLRQYLQQIRLPLDQIYFTSAVKCENSAHYSQCHRHMIAEMIIVKPLVAIAFGYYAGYLFVPEGEQIQPGYTTTLSNETDFMITYSLKDITNETEHTYWMQHIMMAKNQWEYRKQQKEVYV